MTPLSAWQNFYVIVGSSAGALVGLQFVVLTLVASAVGDKVNAESGLVFSTPTIVHFGSVLALSALMNAPWETVTAAATAWGLLGFAGLIYTITTLRRMRKQSAYRPEFEDWLFHIILPAVSYLGITASAFFAPGQAREALFAVAAGALGLLFSGIHNAWDGVTYHVFVKRGR